MTKLDTKHFIMIPIAIAHNSKLSPLSKNVVGEVYTFSIQGKLCFMSNSFFADYYGKSKETISKVIKELRNDNIIKIHLETYIHKVDGHNQKGRRRIITLTNYGKSLCDYLSDNKAQSNSDSQIRLHPSHNTVTNIKGIYKYDHTVPYYNTTRCSHIIRHGMVTEDKSNDINNNRINNNDINKTQETQREKQNYNHQNQELRNQNKNQSEAQQNLNHTNNGRATKIVKKQKQPKRRTDQPTDFDNFKRYDNSGHPLNERTLVASTIYSKFGITLSGRVCKGITLWLTNHTLGQVLKALNITDTKHKQGKHIYSVSKYTSAILNKLPNRSSNQLKSTNTDTKVDYQIIKLAKYIDDACNKQGLGDSTYGNLRIVPTNHIQIHNFIIKNLKHHKINHIKSAFISTCQDYGNYEGNDPLGDTQRQLDVELHDKQNSVTW